MVQSSVRLLKPGVLFVGLILASGWAGAQSPVRVVPGEYLVKFRDQATTVSVSGKIAGKATLKAAFSEMNVFHLAFKPGQEGGVQELQVDPDVEFIEPNYVLDKAEGEIPNQVIETLSESQVHAQSSLTFSQNYASVQVEDAWTIMTAFSTALKVIVAVVDTGIDLNHNVFRNTGALYVNPREIAGNGYDDDYNGYVDDVTGWNYVTNTNNPSDDEGHGTHVSGIIVGTGLDIFSSSLDQSKISVLPLKFLDRNGSGSTANAIKAINYAVNMGAKVINCSWGGGGYSKALLDAVTYAYSHQVLVVSAAGNSAKNNDQYDMYPANYSVPSNISVAATTDSDYLASFSNYGIFNVHIASPGVYIYSTLPGGYFGSMSGTSMAAPFVAGIAAMAMREAPNMTGYQIKQLILATGISANTLSGRVSSGARINAYNLIANAKSNASTLASQPTFSPSYKIERASASEESSKSGGGCGLVSSALSQLPRGGSPGASAGAVVLLLSLPVMLWWSVRRRAPVNQRKYDRFLMNTSIKLKVGDRELVAQMKTISLGGASFNADTALDKGGDVTMRITGPDGNQIEVEGRIVWSEENKAYGVQFSGARDSVLSSIQSWTSRLVKSTF